MFNDVYPINDFGPLMKGLAIGGLGIFHVFLAQFAIGGGFLMQELFPQHAEAMKVEGFWVFLLFAVINIGLISWCFWLVKKNYIQTGNAESAEVE